MDKQRALPSYTTGAEARVYLFVLNFEFYLERVTGITCVLEIRILIAITQSTY